MAEYHYGIYHAGNPGKVSFLLFFLACFMGVVYGYSSSGKDTSINMIGARFSQQVSGNYKLTPEYVLSENAGFLLSKPSRNGKFFAETGISLSDKGYSTPGQILVAGKMKTFNNKLHCYYLGVPVEGGINVLRAYFFAGIIPSVFLFKREVIELNLPESGQDVDVRKLNFDAAIGAGINFLNLSSYSFFTECIYTRQLRPFEENKLSGYFVNYGITLGIKHKI